MNCWPRRTTLDVGAAFLGGLVIAGALVWAIHFGMKVRDQELPRPLPEEQPHLPAGGAVHEMREMREPDEMPVASEEKERLMPYQLHHSGTRTGKDQSRPALAAREERFLRRGRHRPRVT